MCSSQHFVLFLQVFFRLLGRVFTVFAQEVLFQSGLLFPEFLVLLFADVRFVPAEFVHFGEISLFPGRRGFFAQTLESAFIFRMRFSVFIGADVSSQVSRLFLLFDGHFTSHAHLRLKFQFLQFPAGFDPNASFAFCADFAAFACAFGTGTRVLTSPPKVSKCSGPA